MDIRYKLYPYPVLITDTDDYVNSSFQFAVDVKKGIRELEFSFTMDLQNAEMEQLIRDGFAEYLIHIECPQTCYREVVKSNEMVYAKRIPEKDLNGKVSICAFVVAKRELAAYSNSDFNPDYENASFTIEKGSILAIGGQYDLNIVKDTEELAKIPSIFTICKYAADTDASMKIDIDGDKIVIALSDSSFEDYKLLTNMPSLIAVFHAIIIVPALIYVFETLRREELEDYENRRWFMAIRKTLAKHDVNLTKETLNEIASYDLAQKLLDLPVDRALRALTTMEDDGEE